ncbi:hypothetical protein Desca_0672 [Desulfotomaculum nigrificans CO-1-SRB]|uniref:DUF3006 domain-containing protein n=1 Tax=Desulfotomaculum nigrificans (strain DSM 14880 / VKM B-2319 / CO-1-SRB) TaxID=868595 RepID=F6B8I5_DESCC|nr:DUF3006 domain-containing protein [Desulfotomaculum nigrificans]AEF93557.1 hypothetical protein Desca_0672 [Desulfotomaculum nigrificans CO-1-SRB]
MKAIIDRFEGTIAVLEVDDTTMWHVPRKFLPDTAREGDVVEFSFKLNPAATEAAKAANRRLLDDVFK